MYKEEFLETVILFFCSVCHAFDYHHSFGQIGKVRLTDPNLRGFSTPNILQQRSSKFTIVLDVKLLVKLFSWNGHKINLSITTIKMYTLSHPQTIYCVSNKMFNGILFFQLIFRM